MKIIEKSAELEVGRWYAIGVKGLDDKINWSNSDIYKYEGDGCWTDDNREPVETTWDPVLQESISINSADAFMLQS